MHALISLLEMSSPSEYYNHKIGFVILKTYLLTMAHRYAVSIIK